MTNGTPLVLAVPSKGRLQENATAFFARAGLEFMQGRGARDYRGAIVDLPGVEVAYLSASEIVGQLAAGSAHLGVTGEDLVREQVGDADQRLALLTPLGFAVVAAASGEECLLLVEERSPKLILLDIAMPEMDGWQVAQRLRRRPGERAAILILSANAVDPHHMLEAGRLYDDTMLKPIDLRQLLKKIHALLNIEWIYEADAAPSPLPDASPFPPLLPRGEEIDELIQLGEIGHFRRILEKLNEIEKTAPECRDFVARIRGIVDAFDFKRYATVLREIRGTHA